MWLILPLSGSSLCQVKHLPRVQIPHERLADLGSLKYEKKNNRSIWGKKYKLIEPHNKDKITLIYSSSAWSASLTRPSNMMSELVELHDTQLSVRYSCTAVCVGFIFSLVILETLKREVKLLKIKIQSSFSVVPTSNMRICCFCLSLLIKYFLIFHSCSGKTYHLITSEIVPNS